LYKFCWFLKQKRKEKEEMRSRDEVGCYLAGPDGRTCDLSCNEVRYGHIQYVRSGHIRYGTRSLQPPGKPGRVSRAPGKQPAAATSSSSLRRDHRIRRVEYRVRGRILDTALRVSDSLSSSTSFIASPSARP
jgi:hypothetical protein